MAERIVINIARPEVGIFYEPESPEAEAADQLAAAELGLHALAQRALQLRSHLGLQLPTALTNIVVAETWRDLS
jgi:hypothetical protein